MALILTQSGITFNNIIPPATQGNSQYNYEKYKDKTTGEDVTRNSTEISDPANKFINAIDIDWNGAQVSLKDDLEPRTINTTGDLLKAVQDASNVGGEAADGDTKNTAGNKDMKSTKLFLVGTVSQESQGVDFGISYTNEGFYIGSDNSLYSNGEKVAIEEVATTTKAGLMSISDKQKLNGIETGANNYTLPAATNRTLGGIRTNYID